MRYSFTLTRFNALRSYIKADSSALLLQTVFRGAGVLPSEKKERRERYLVLLLSRTIRNFGKRGIKVF